MAGQSHPVARSAKGNPRPSVNRYGPDFEALWTEAAARIKRAGGLDIDREARAVHDPVQKARRLAEVAAAADMRLTIAYGHADPRTHEPVKGYVSLALQAAFRRLAAVGVRSGDVVEHDLSDRFQDFMQRFSAARAPDPPRARPLPAAGPDPGAPPTTLTRPPRESEGASPHDAAQK